MPTQRFHYIRIPATPSEAFPHAAYYHRPLIPVTLSTGPKSARLLALIDSGADNTIFNMQVAAMLGLVWAKRPRIRSAGHPVTNRRHDTGD